MGRGPGEGGRRAPGPGYRDVSAAAYFSYGWSASAVCVPDEVVRAALASSGFVVALEERGIRAEPGGDVRLHGAVELLADILADGH